MIEAQGKDIALDIAKIEADIAEMHKVMGGDALINILS